MAFIIGKDCKIHPSAFINVEEGFLGDRSIINEGARIEGHKVEIGKEAFIDRFSIIGGGSCFDKSAYLKAGDWLHMGMNSQINIARGVDIGNEFGCGVETKIFTHGAYIDSYSLGAPIQWDGITIGNNVWLPNAWVNPGVDIGSNVIAAARSLIKDSVPSNTFIAGIPAKVIKENAFKEPEIDVKSKLIDLIMSQCKDRPEINNKWEYFFNKDTEILSIIYDASRAYFDLKNRTISGDADKQFLIIKDQLRRNGIRFKFYIDGNNWASW